MPMLQDLSLKGPSTRSDAPSVLTVDIVGIYFRFYCHRARKSTGFRTPLQQNRGGTIMPGVRLTQRRVHALRPSRKVRDVRAPR